MTDWYKLHKNPWVRRCFFGGIGILGAMTSFSDGTAKNASVSPAMQLWISDAKRKDGKNGYSIAELSQQPDNLIEFAAHRSHRSHSSHYSSSGGGHRSHSSHYSSYSAPKDSPGVPATPSKQVDRYEKKDPTISTVSKKVVTTPDKDKTKLIIEAKTGTVKSIVSPTAFVLEDSTIVELIGVKERNFPDPVADANAHAAAQAALTGWINGKSVRFNFVEGNKAYVFVFPTELECYCVNLELVRDGNLVVDSNTSIYARNVLLTAQREAQSKDVGIWKKETAQK